MEHLTELPNNPLLGDFQDADISGCHLLGLFEKLRIFFRQRTPGMKNKSVYFIKSKEL